MSALDGVVSREPVQILLPHPGWRILFHGPNNTVESELLIVWALCRVRRVTGVASELEVVGMYQDQGGDIVIAANDDDFIGYRPPEGDA